MIMQWDIDILFQYGSIIEYSGLDKNGKPVFLCQFGIIDFEGMVSSFLPCQVMLHFLYLMEMVENTCAEVSVYVKIGYL